MRWGRISGMFLVVGFVGLMAFGLSRDPTEIASPLVGETAPGFELRTLEGGDTVALGDLRGTPVVMNFWASWCTACIYEHPPLVRAWRRWGRTGEIELLGIVYQDTPENAGKFLERHGGGWTQLLDPGTRTAIDYGVYGVPETFFIDASGTLAHKHTGPVTDSVLTREIGRLVRDDPEARTAPTGTGAPDGEEPPGSPHPPPSTEGGSS